MLIMHIFALLEPIVLIELSILSLCHLHQNVISMCSKAQNFCSGKQTRTKKSGVHISIPENINMIWASL